MRAVLSLLGLVTLSLVATGVRADIGEPQNSCPFNWEEDGQPHSGSVSISITGPCYPLLRVTTDPGLWVQHITFRELTLSAHSDWETCTESGFGSPLCEYYPQSGLRRFAWLQVMPHNAEYEVEVCGVDGEGAPISCTASFTANNLVVANNDTPALLACKPGQSNSFDIPVLLADGATLANTDVDVEIYLGSGSNPVRVLHSTVGGNTSVHWDGKDAAGTDQVGICTYDILANHYEPQEWNCHDVDQDRYVDCLSECALETPQQHSEYYHDLASFRDGDLQVSCSGIQCPDCTNVPAGWVRFRWSYQLSGDDAVEGGIIIYSPDMDVLTTQALPDLDAGAYGPYEIDVPIDDDLPCGSYWLVVWARGTSRDNKGHYQRPAREAVSAVSVSGLQSAGPPICATLAVTNNGLKSKRGLACPGGSARVEIDRSDIDLICTDGPYDEQSDTLSVDWTCPTGWGCTEAQDDSYVDLTIPSNASDGIYEVVAVVDDDRQSSDPLNDDAVTKKITIAVGSDKICDCEESGDDPVSGAGGCGADGCDPGVGLRSRHPGSIGGTGGAIGGPGPGGGDGGPCPADSFTTAPACSANPNVAVMRLKTCDRIECVWFAYNDQTGLWSTNDPRYAGLSVSGSAQSGYTASFPDGRTVGFNGAGEKVSDIGPDGAGTELEWVNPLASVTAQNGTVWTYNKPSGDGTNEPEEVVAETGEKVVWAYYDSTDNPAQNGLLSGQTVYDSSGTPMSSVTFEYNEDGDIETITADNGRQTVYAYDASRQVASVTVLDASVTPAVTLSLTTYSYGDDYQESGTGLKLNYTTERRRASTTAEGQADQITTTYFYQKDNDGPSTYVYKVERTAESGTLTTTYKRFGWVSNFASDPDRPRDEQNNVYDDPALYGLPWKVVGPGQSDDNATLYKYYSVSEGPGQGKYGWNRQLRQVTYPKPDAQAARPYEQFSYYDSGGVNRPWLTVKRDVRGKYFRTTYDSGGHALSEEVSPTGQSGSYTLQREFQYYGVGDDARKLGMLKKESAPNIDGALAWETSYDYEEGSPAKVRTSPTTVTRWWRNASSADEQVTATNHYDDLGRLLVATDEEQHSTAYRYDGLGRVTQVDEGYTGTFAADRETSYDCCGVSRQGWKKDASWLYTHYETDRMGRTTDVSVPSSDPDSAAPLVHNAYNLLGQTEAVASYRDTGAGRTTSYTYNRLGQTTKIVHPYDTTEEDRLCNEEFDYYESGALKWKQERDDSGNLSKTYFEYDDLGRRTGTDYAYDGTFDADVSFEYEGGSELVTTVHEAGGLGDTVYAYDDLGRLKTYEPPKPSGFQAWYKLEYEYNTLGAKTKMTLTLPSGAKKYTRYAYRRDGNVWNVMWPTPSWPPTVMSQYLYFKNGLPKWTVYGQIDASSYRTLYGYDSLNRATSVEHFHRTSSPWNGAKMSGRSATLDEQGNPTAIDEWHDAQTTFHNTYTYDDFNRLTGWSLEGQQQDAWTYDRVGNWTMSGWTADAKADMLTASPGSQTYTYTPRGSLKEVYDNQQQTHTFGYDAEGLLTGKADMQQQRLSLMGWDHAGRRIELTPNGGTPWRFIYDPTASVPAVAVEDLNGTPQAFYVREPDGRLIAREAGESLQYYFFDLLGSTILMAPATEGNPTDRFCYTPWGQTVTTGSRASTIATTSNPYRYVGSLGYYHHHQDANLADWMQLGVRFYDPELGRFERRDPLLEGPNAYRYSPNPLVAVDPSGLYCWGCHYFRGRGEPVIIRRGDPDWLRFWNSAVVVASRRAFESSLRQAAARAARAACAGRGAQGLVHVGFQSARTVNPDMTWYPGFLWIGDTTVVESAQCVVGADCCRRRFLWTCQTRYEWSDWIRDAADPRDTAPGYQEFIGGHPYAVSSTNALEIGGAGAF